MKERAVLRGSLRSFGPVTSQSTVAKYLSEGREAVSCESSRGTQHVWEERLSSLGFPLRVGVENDAPTFHTANFAGFVFFLRDAVGDEATMCTGAGGTH